MAIWGLPVRAGYYKKNLFAVITSLLVFLSTVQAQSVVTGKIVDAVSRQPLAAATISEENNQNHSAITDQDGNFLLRVANLQLTLKASFVGYNNVTVPLAGKKVLRIEMNAGAVNLEDVVIEFF